MFVALKVWLNRWKRNIVDAPVPKSQIRFPDMFLFSSVNSDEVISYQVCCLNVLIWLKVLKCGRSTFTGTLWFSIYGYHSMFRTRTHGLYRFLLGWGSGSDSRSKSARNMEHLPYLQCASLGERGGGGEVIAHDSELGDIQKGHSVV